MVQCIFESAIHLQLDKVDVCYQQRLANDSENGSERDRIDFFEIFEDCMEQYLTKSVTDYYLRKDENEAIDYCVFKYLTTNQQQKTSSVS